MRLHKFLADEESQTETIDRTEFLQAMKLLKDSIKITVWNTSSAINHRHLQFAIDNLAANIDWLVRGRKLNSIAEQIDEHLRDQIEIHGYQGKI